jgi:hypothetical protein
VTAPDPGCSVSTFSPSPLEAIVQQLVVQVVHQVVPGLVRAELDRQRAGTAAPDRRGWLSQPQAAQLAGVSVSTVRAWQGAGRLTKGDRGRVSASELRALLAGRQAPPQAGAIDLAAARIAGSLRGGK